MRSNTGAALVLLLVTGIAALYAYTSVRPALIIAILSTVALLAFFRCVTPEMRARIGPAPFVLAIGLPIAAWMMSDIWLLYGVALIAVPLLARTPGHVAPIYLFGLLLLPGLVETTAIGSLKLVDIGVHQSLALGAMFCLATRPGKARIPLALDLPVLPLLLLLIVATSRDTSVTNFFRVFVNNVLNCALPYYIVSRSIRSVDDLKLCMIYLAAAASVLSVILLYEAHSSWPMYNVLYKQYDIPVQLMVKSRGGVLRAGGPFMESTSMAMVLAFCFLATWLSRPAFKSGWHHLAVMGFSFAGLTAPQSRGAWIGLFIGMLVADVYRRRTGSAIRRIVTIGLLGAALITVAPMSPYLSDTLGLAEGSASTVDYRQRLFDRGMEEFWKSPIIGYSPPQILAHLSDLRQGEGIIDFVNTYIYFALMAGVIGLAVFINAFLIHLVRLAKARRLLRQDNPDIDGFALAFAGLVMPMEMLIFTSFGGRCETFVFVFFAFAAAIVSTRGRVRWEVRTPPPPWQYPQTSGASIALTP